ncbi:LamG-like jellyroll fold domain-containing protein [Niabella aurantiaca]|uniref:LamG-like jellyroll fold domain-containing protein n=1 Tax=Niabella aurantiaca TaxID=379900 RepID=UPI00036FCBCD|nr:LamG-like jellyroll fold domain-containing protein [Niabella aurantiaca]
MRTISTSIIGIRAAAIVAALFFTGAIHISGQRVTDRVLRADLENCPGLIALWDFKEKAGHDRVSSGRKKFRLKERGGSIQRVPEGPLSGYAIALNGVRYLSIPYTATGALNVRNNAVTVIAWVKWSGSGVGFVAGMWNEYLDGGKRQYGLFVNLPHYNGGNQVCGHISKTGKATPPFPYCIEYSASKQLVPKAEWSCVAFTYDGKYIRSYLNGVFERRGPEQIRHTRGFEGYPDGLIQVKNPYYFPDGIGDNGSEFTVGSVQLTGGAGNFFKGLIGGLAVFDRALTNREMSRLAIVPGD